MLKSWYQPNFLLQTNNNYIRGHNVSFTPVPDFYQKVQYYHNYIYVVRVDEAKPEAISKIQGYTGDNVVPGNGHTCQSSELNDIKYGDFFWWNNWGSIFYHQSKTLFLSVTIQFLVSILYPYAFVMILNFTINRQIIYSKLMLEFVLSTIMSIFMIPTLSQFTY